MILRTCVAALVCLPAAAFAQGNPGPFGGLFGRTPERTGREFTAIDLRSTVAGQYDEALLVPEGEVNPLREGSTAGVTAGIAYERNTDRLKVDLRSTGMYQGYYQQPASGTTAVDAGGTVSGKVTNRLTLDAAAGYLYSPYYYMQPSLAPPPFTGDVPIPGNPYAARLYESHMYDASTGFTWAYSKRSTLTGFVSRQETRFVRRPEDNFEVDGAGARWTRRLSRDFALRAGYGREIARYKALPDSEYLHEVIDLGVDFSRGFNPGRRTTLGVTTQTSVIKERNGPRRYRLDGSISLTRFFARTWNASISAVRNTEFLAGFTEPLFSDSLNAGVGGMLSKRADWFLSGGISRGYFGVDASGRYTTSQAASRLSFALTRYIGLFGQYSFYRYDLPPNAPSSMALINQMSRQSITAGVSLWAPVMQRVRTSQ